MKAQIKCKICGEVIATIEKDVIKAEDLNLYKEMSSCHEHGQEDLIVEILE